MNYDDLVAIFKEHIYTPHNYTDCFWYPFERSGIHYSAQYELDKNPDLWIGGGYTSEFQKDSFELLGYRIVTLDDGCGGEFQAFFKLSMEIDPEEFD